MQKKKLIAVLLLVAMLFTLVPATAMAGTEDATELTAQQVLLWNEDASVPVVASGSELNWEFGVNPDNIAGYVTISIEDYAKRFEDSAVKEQKGVILEKTQVPFAVGETAADVTVRLLDYLEIAHEIDYTWGFYIKAMAGLQEGDTAQYSGWYCSYDNEFLPMAASDYYVQDGTKLCWQYTSEFGADVIPGGGAVRPEGGSDSSSSSSSSAAKPEDNKIPAELPTTGTGVADLIASVGNIDKNSGDLLQAAREAYDKLTAEEQKLVKNYDQLLAAEREYGRLTNPLPFADVKEQHWAKEAIQYVYSKDLMNGSKDGAFEPEAELSRAMLVTILYRLEGAPAVAGHNTFTDVTDRDWFTNAVLWASSNNLVSGYGDGKFGANDAITREQLASILMRYSQYKQYDTGKKANLDGFADKGQISSWAESSVAWAKAEGLLNGRTAANIAPQGEVTRAETAAILMRYLQKFELTKIK